MKPRKAAYNPAVSLPHHIFHPIANRPLSSGRRPGTIAATVARTEKWIPACAGI